MSEELKDVAPASEEPRQSAAQILEQIKEKQRELDTQKAAQAAQAQEPALIQDSVAPAPALAGSEPNKPAEPAPESSAGAVPGPSGDDKPDWKKWIEKKGFKSTEDMVRSMRELERELHRRGQGQGATPLPAIPGPSNTPRPYYPPQPPPNESVEQLAKRYNLDPEDFQKVAPLAADIASAQVGQRIAPLMAELNRLNREVARNAELQSLKEDPAFENPRVQFEMHRILESNPSIIQNEPAPWRYAFNEALRTMGRRILDGSIEPITESKPVSGSVPYAMTPPRTAGGGSAPTASQGIGIKPPERMSAEAFKRLPAAEQRKVLEKLKAVADED